MTVLDYLKKQFDPTRPTWFQTPAGLRRVISVNDDWLPKVIVQTEDGGTAQFWVLLGTELVQEQDCSGCNHVHALCCVCSDPMPCDDAGIDGDFVCDACVHYEVVDEPVPASWLILGRNHCE